MFICEDCERKTGTRIPEYMRLFGESYGPCELCHKTAGCVDWHGGIGPAKSGERKDGEAGG